MTALADGQALVVKVLPAGVQPHEASLARTVNEDE